MRARPEAIEALALRYQLGWQPVAGDGALLSAELLSAEVGLAEGVLAVRSRSIGRTLAEINLAEPGDATARPPHLAVLSRPRGARPLTGRRFPSPNG